MVWNPEVNRWEFILFSSPRTFELKFSADANYQRSWGWPVTGGSNGVSVPNPSNNVTVALVSSGYHRIRFEEISGRYEVGSMASTDSDGDGMPDDWERFYILNPLLADDANGDADGDMVLNKFEYARGSHPLIADHNSQMSIPGNFPLFFGDTSGTWEPTNARKAMRWNPNNARWEAMIFAPTNSSLEFKFAAGAWTNGTWGWNSNSVPGQSSKWPNGTNSGNISYSLPSRGYYVVRFEEYQGSYVVTSLDLSDANQNGLPDEWEYLCGVTDPGGNPDSDAWVNRSEYYRGTDPQKNDAGVPAKRMTVTGNASPLPNWIPSADNMTWSDQRLRWEWATNFTQTINIEIKFARGDWVNAWGWASNSPTPGVALSGGPSNIVVAVTNGVRYLFSFDDIMGRYDVSPFPPSLDWLSSNNLSNIPQDPWPLDTDRDGTINLLEYALGGNPNLADSNRLVSSWATNSAGSNRLVLRWSQRTNANVQAEWHTNLSGTGWATSGLS
ncbi:MAG: hypothetical protein EBS53_16635, partial [Bacteroidetes bacterium]|nr:hypothetical protein [Bacteroidota bacterium]